MVSLSRAALFELAAPSTPEPVRETVIETVTAATESLKTRQATWAKPAKLSTGVDISGDREIPLEGTRNFDVCDKSRDKTVL